MRIRILPLLRGARKASGTAVVIDVFRAFSLETYAFAAGADKIICTASVEDAFKLRDQNPGSIIAGERGGAKCPGFDCGNSPSQLAEIDLAGKTVIHTTSAGTQGIEAASGADEILTGALVNASATAEYIRASGTEDVSLIPMGLAGRKKTEEDMICADYLKALILGTDPGDIGRRIRKLKYTDGSKFFSPYNEEIFPREDFFMCTEVDRFGFAIRVGREDGLLVSRKVPKSGADC
ncbi:MAG: 2-phosphosulfolactate phosphatase [Oscillospiraceae bacterium]|jgi:2-phosphosulfolactate phosphatase